MRNKWKRITNTNDEYIKWWKTLRQQHKYTRIHDNANRSLTFAERLKRGVEVYHTLKKKGTKRKRIFCSSRRRRRICTRLKKMKKKIRCNSRSNKKAGYEPGKEIALALDIASTEMYEEAQK